MKFLLIHLWIFLSLLNNSIYSQTNYSCGQHLIFKKLLLDSTFKKRYENDQLLIDEKSSIRQFTKGTIFKIPVAFHVLHNNGIEKISREQVLDALENLNLDLRALRADTATVDSLFKPIIADVEVEFVLATKAPDGTCFSGITYTESPSSYNNGEIDGSDQLNDVINYNDVYQGIWPGNMYLNVLICGSVGDGIAGYAYYPNGNGLSMDWGIWLRHDYCGSIGTSSPSASKTFVHEVGHWLNLPHTWGSTNEPNLVDNCNSDDGVEDTPNTIGSTWCNYNESTCGEIANIENHMEYSSCRKMFTLGQKDRMRTALTSSIGGRSNLITPYNHQQTGIDIEPPFCKADFFAENYITCTGDSLFFEDQSYHHPIYWDWYFEGANPNSSTLQNNYSHYSTPGLYDISLTASGDSLNFITEIKNDRVVVMDYVGEQLPYFESFENTDFSSPNWVLSSGNWSVTNTTSYSGNNCLKITNLGSVDGTKHVLESKTFDLSDSLRAYFSFKYAFAKRSEDNSDNLRILASKDCGKTWSVRKVIQYGQLTTAPNQTGFIPTNEQWNEAIISSIIGPYCVSNFRFKFEFTSGGGNDLFIDDINISLENNLDISKINKNDVVIFPNPSSSRLNVNSLIPIINIQVFDLSGKLIVDLSDLQQNKKSIDIEFLNKGFYTIIVKTKSGRINRKFIKN